MFPWREVMSVGFGVLGLAPRDFWSMTLLELSFALSGLQGPHLISTPLAKDEFNALMMRYPDRAE